MSHSFHVGECKSTMLILILISKITSMIYLKEEKEPVLPIRVDVRDENGIEGV